MVAESAQFLLVLALVLACCQVWFCWQSAHHQEAYHRHARHIAFLLFALLGVAFVLLIVSFLRSDFSVALVAAHSHSTKPWFYKIAASWGNHEGSLLLWVLLLALYGAWFALPWGGRRALSPEVKFYTLMVQAVLLVLFLSFLIFTSNPFARLEPAPFQGGGLNPILQDIALVMHPPILYLGYVGFSIVFSVCLAVLLSRARSSHNWVDVLRAPVMWSWSTLTIGIGLGSWWAYRELGWGGFWFWDPVENASLMPWLVATALLHSLLVAKLGKARGWLILLGSFTFLFSILGTFLTRSGLITSVHSFASDPSRGIFMFGILLLLLAATLVLYRSEPQQAEKPTAFFSREAMLLGNNLFLCSATLAVLLGTIYPMVLESFGGARVSVGAPYFYATFVPLMVAPLVLMPLAFWAGARLRTYQFWFAPALLLALLLGAFFQPLWSLAGFGFALALWLLFGTFTSSFILGRNALARLPHLLAHGGLGILLLGAIGTTATQQETIYAFAPKEKISFLDYELTFAAERTRYGKDFSAQEAEVIFSHEGEELARLYPQVRSYIARPQATREAAIYTSFFPLFDFHAILGDKVEGKRTVQFYFNPLAPLLWLGVALMGLGGLLTLIPKKS